MLVTPRYSDAEADANASFEALLWALSRPGQLRTLPDPGESGIITALIDRECRVYSADPRLLPLAMRSGAEIVDLPQADHAFLGELADARVLRDVQLGSDLYPDDGATVILRARLGSGQRLRLTGPGVHGSETISVNGVPAEFWALRAELIRYPMGFDLFLLDGATLAGVPRSTTVEVL